MVSQYIILIGAILTFATKAMGCKAEPYKAIQKKLLYKPYIIHPAQHAKKAAHTTVKQAMS